MEITAGDVLVQVQRLLGEPAGSYYDLRFRLQQLNMAQVEMIQDAIGSISTIEIPVYGDDIYLPEDYLTMAKQKPYYKSPQNHVYPLRVEDVSGMDRNYPGWQDAVGHNTSPHTLIVDGSRRVRLHPNPSSGVLVFPYTNAPEPMWGEDDVIFNGDPTLARFATGLAYKVAAQEIMGVRPEQGQHFLNLYNQELRRMRESRRTTPAREQRARGSFGYRRRRV